jgi:Predicted phosphoesterase
MKRILAISDIHGELELFDSLLEKVNYDADEDQLILLGDYVDRGQTLKGY